jgi:hypothetical protein
MPNYKDFATAVQAMRQHQRKRGTSSAKLILQQCAALELKVDGMLKELFPDAAKEVEQPKMELGFVPTNTTEG